MLRDDIGCTLGLCDPSVPLKRNPLQLIAMSALLWLFAHRLSRLCSLIAVSELFDALHVLQHSRGDPSKLAHIATAQRRPGPYFESDEGRRERHRPVAASNTSNEGELFKFHFHALDRQDESRHKTAHSWYLQPKLSSPCAGPKGLCAEISVKKKAFFS